MYKDYTMKDLNQNLTQTMLDLARRHYNTFNMSRNKGTKDDKEKYYKCWVNDMYNILHDYNINIETFLFNLINN